MGLKVVIINYINLIYSNILRVAKSMLSLLKLRGVLVRVSAVNLCGAKSTYLLLPLGPSISGIGESRVCLPAADQGESVALQHADVPPLPSTNRPSPVQPKVRK